MFLSEIPKLLLLLFFAAYTLVNPFLSVRLQVEGTTSLLCILYSAVNVVPVHGVKPSVVS